MVFYYNDIELSFKDDYVAKLEACVGQPFEEFMLFCIEHYLEKEELRQSEQAIKNAVVAGHSFVEGWMKGDAARPENKDKEIITIYYNDLPIEFKKKNVALYENVVLSVLSDIASLYVKMHLRDKSQIGDKDAVKTAIVIGMNNELKLYGLEIVEDLVEEKWEPGTVKVYHIAGRDIEASKTEEIFGASMQNYMVWVEFPLKHEYIIQIEDEFIDFFHMEVLYDLNKLNEFLKEQRRLYSAARFCKGIVRKITGNAEKIFQSKAYGKELKEIILSETTELGSVEVMRLEE